MISRKEAAVMQMISTNTRSDKDKQEKSMQIEQKPSDQEEVGGEALAAEILSELQEDEVESDTAVDDFLGGEIETEFCTIKPQLLFTFSIADPVMYEHQNSFKEGVSVVRANDRYVNVYNPMKKGKGTKEEPVGALRGILPQLMNAVNDIGKQSIVVLGQPSDVEKASDIVRAKLDRKIERLVSSSFCDSEKLNFVVKDANFGVDIDELVSVTSWLSSDEEQEATIATINININMPMLYSGEQAKKSLYEFIKVIYGVLSSNYSAYSQNFKAAFAVSIGTQLLALPSVRTLVDDMFSEVAGDAETTEPAYSYTVLAEVHNQASDDDVVRQFLFSYDPDVAVKVFAHSGDIMFIRPL